MLINYFDNSSMFKHLSKYFQESHDRNDLLSSKFSDKCKKRFRRRKGHEWKILDDQPQKFIR